MQALLTLRCPRIADEPVPVQRTALSDVRNAASAIKAPTELGVYRTETHLVVRFTCQDSDIWGTFTEHDDPLYEEEVVEVFLCPSSDLRHYYEFEVSPRNVVFDAKVYCPDLHRGTMHVDTAWNCPGLETSVTVEGELHTTPPAARAEEKRRRGVREIAAQHSPFTSWIVELRIPFSAFPEVNPPEPGDAWRANFYRIDRADPPEFTAWSPTLENPPNFHVPECFGYLVFE